MPFAVLPDPKAKVMPLFSQLRHAAQHAVAVESLASKGIPVSPGEKVNASTNLIIAISQLEAAVMEELN